MFFVNRICGVNLRLNKTFTNFIMSCPEIEPELFKSISTASSDRPVLIDVRSSEEYQNDKVENSFNIPYDTIKEAFLMDSVAFEKIYGFSQPSKDTEVILFCTVGIRSMKACQSAISIGFNNVKNLKGGIKACQ
uniref:Thiosulfate sulfurtransferase/rhodanese-like domain-containing protein 3 (Trinotate prediction) n=1 Tax=Myxobolus squamalis TaxID=59785 RepID=A0A6B2GAM8_MYXSQ